MRRTSGTIGLAARLLTAAVTAVALAGCTTPYVDGGLKDVPATAYAKLPAPQPAQVLFEFQSKGVANAQATALLKEGVFNQVRSSGLFSAVTEAPAPSGALLTITVNNIPVTDDAFSKGFATGLTFGLVGSHVTDGYVCEARYRPGGSAPVIARTARHAIHASLGSAGPPPNAIKVESLDVAVRMMMRQIVGNVLLDVSRDEGSSGRPDVPIDAAAMAGGERCSRGLAARERVRVCRAAAGVCERRHTRPGQAGRPRLDADRHV